MAAPWCGWTPSATRPVTWSTPAERFDDDGYALRFGATDLPPVDREWPWVDDILGDVRVQVSTVDSEPVFAGIARTADVAHFLDGVPHRAVMDHRYGPNALSMTLMRPPGMPRGAGIWVESAAGTGTLTLDWAPQPGDWSLVVMNAAAAPGVHADVAVGASAPALGPFAFSVLAGGVVALLGGALLVAFGARPRRPAS